MASSASRSPGQTSPRRNTQTDLDHATRFFKAGSSASCVGLPRAWHRGILPASKAGNIPKHLVKMATSETDRHGQSGQKVLPFPHPAVATMISHPLVGDHALSGPK